MNILIDGQTLQSPEVNRGIGIYFKNTLNDMVKMSFVHNWYIAVSDKKYLNALDPWVAERMIPIENDIFTPTSDFSRTEAFTKALEEIVEEKNIDVFWCPNPLMVNVLFINRSLKCRMFSMLHDIIPAIMPVKEWSQAVRKEYQRRLDYLKSEDMSLLCNSYATRDDFIKHICPREGMYVTQLAADSKKFYKKRTAKKEKDEVTIVFTGGFDYRKNMDGAVEALAKAYAANKENKLIRNAKMHIVCNTDETTKNNFYQKVANLGIDGKVVLTGFIPDKELSALYQKCDVFFFPSLYEGFGLPIVEAMLAGAYVLSADNSSLPEVCGKHAMLCNASDLNDMAEKLMQALEQAEQESLEEIHARQEYALTFSWERTAAETLAAFAEKDADYAKKKLAVVTPWPKQQTGIANYVYNLIPAMSKYFDIDIFVDNTIASKDEMLPYTYGNLYMIDALDQQHQNYDEILYHMGNSSDFHTGIYRMMTKYKGIAEIHDYILHPFFYHSFCLKKEFGTYKDALVNGYGTEGEAHYKRVKDKTCWPDEVKYPMSHSVAAVSKAVIFHNHWSKEQMNGKNVYTIPLASFDRVDMDETVKKQHIERFEKLVGFEKGDVIVGCFGFVNENKRPISVISAVSALRESGCPVKLVFFGKSNIGDLEAKFKDENLSEFVFTTGYLDKEEYEAGLEFTDIVVNLRYPSMGEASATLCEAFQYGKAVLVSDLNQYKEFPDEICWKVPVNNAEVKTLTDMIGFLIDHAEVRAALGKNAENYANEVLNVEMIAKQYADVINRIMEM